MCVVCDGVCVPVDGACLGAAGVGVGVQLSKLGGVILAYIHGQLSTGGSVFWCCTFVVAWEVWEPVSIRTIFVRGVYLVAAEPRRFNLVRATLWSTPSYN